MPLMVKARRGLALFVAAALAFPAASLPFVHFDTVSKAENRSLSPWLSLPKAPATWAAFPRTVDTFVADHFGFREPMVALGNRIFGPVRHDAAEPTAPVGGLAATDSASAPPNGPAPAQPAAPLVADGRHGRMFLVDGLLSSTGHTVNEARDTDYARFVCNLAETLRPKGVRVIFSIAPSPASIYPEDAPSWALPLKSPSDADIVLRAVQACGVTAVNVRPALRAAKGAGRLYRLTDTHWTPLGALVAYDQIVARIGRPGWAIPLAKVHYTVDSGLTNGDLPRMAARAPVPEDLATPDALFLNPGAKKHDLPELGGPPGELAYMIETGRPGPGVLVIGDSFTEHYLPFYFAHGAGRAGWIHAQVCNFDQAVFDAVKPDYVLIMPTERNIFCAPLSSPAH